MALVFQHGKDSKCWVNGTDLSSALTDVSHTATVDMAEVTAFNGDDKAYLPGQRDGTITLSGLYEGSTSRASEVLYDQLGGSTDPIITFGPGQSTGGGPAVLISGPVSGWSVNAPAQDVVSVSADVQNSTTNQYQGQWLVASPATFASSSAGAARSFGSTTSNSTGGWRAHIHVTAMTTGDITFKLQHSSGVAWADKATVTITKAVSSSALKGYQLQSTGTAKELVRLLWDTMDSTSITFAAAVARGVNP